MNAIAGTSRYVVRRSQLEHYFDRTAVDAWTTLTSNEPVSGIRATVRAGRDAMRAQLLDWLPDNLTGEHLLDAGCGTGAACLAAAERGAQVVGVDISPSLVGIAAERGRASHAGASVRFVAGDMLDPALGTFDHVLAMDSLIHYDAQDVLAALETLCARTRRSIVFTVAPWTPLLAVMHAVGRLLPAADRAPDIEPVRPDRLIAALGERLRGSGWFLAGQARVSTGFYKSHGIWLTRG